MDYVTADILENLIVNNPTTGSVKLSEFIHLHKKYPENHNIRITNSRSKDLEIYKDDKWQYCGKIETLNSMIEEKQFMLSEHFHENENDMKYKYKSRKIDAFLDVNRKIEDGDRKVLKQLRDDADRDNRKFL